MKAGRFLVISFLVFAYLIAVNALLFPVIFREGLAEKFSNTRQNPINVFHVLAFGATAFLLTAFVARLLGSGSRARAGALAGASLGLLVALPEHLHLYAMVEATALHQFIPVAWILATWSVAGLLVGILGPRSE